jgi:hypothetical protein
MDQTLVSPDNDGGDEIWLPDGITISLKATKELKLSDSFSLPFSDRLLPILARRM